MTDPALAIVRRLYEDARVGDWEAVAGSMSEDLVIHEAPALPYGGEWRGRHALRDLYAHVVGHWDAPVIEQDALTSDGDGNVVALVRLTTTSRHSGERVTHRIAEVNRVEQGKVVEMRIFYFDEALVLAELAVGAT